ncbi:MAG: hypothetical protein L6Q71_10775 [Planctomycetes bacterium]|nr:hypothetical protein [Planctomycetota bacterium]
MKKKPVTVLCIYRVKKGKEKAFEKLLDKHWPTLRKRKLVTKTPSVAYAGEEKKGIPVYFEILSWRNAKSPELAHADKKVMAIWEAMGKLLEKRGSRPQWEFFHVRKV